MKRLGISLLVALVITAVAYPVFAWGPGWGRGHHMGGYSGGGRGYCFQYDRGYGNLTADQEDKLDRLNQQYLNDTYSLKSQIWKKSRELNDVLDQTNPDVEKAKVLQKEINDLRAKISDKNLALELEASKIAPENRAGKGSGRGYGRQRGGYGQGGCW